MDLVPIWHLVAPSADTMYSLLVVTGVPIILVGTKSDMRNDPAANQALASKGSTPVSFDEAKGCASQIGAKLYLECSALTQEGLKNVFDEAIRAALNKNKGKQSNDACCDGCNVM